jgi:hypothetical protein
VEKIVCAAAGAAEAAIIATIKATTPGTNFKASHKNITSYTLGGRSSSSRATPPPATSNTLRVSGT